MYFFRCPLWHLYCILQLIYLISLTQFLARGSECIGAFVSCKKARERNNLFQNNTSSILVHKAFSALFEAAWNIFRWGKIFLVRWFCLVFFLEFSKSEILGLKNRWFELLQADQRFVYKLKVSVNSFLFGKYVIFFNCFSLTFMKMC